jgi:hypothetical protein
MVRHGDPVWHAPLRLFRRGRRIAMPRQISKQEAVGVIAASAYLTREQRLQLVRYRSQSATTKAITMHKMPTPGA